MEDAEKKFIRNYKIMCEQLQLYLVNGKLKPIDSGYQKQIKALENDIRSDGNRLDNPAEN